MSIELRHVGVVVSDLERALPIYTEYLGFTLLKYYSELTGPYQSELVSIADVVMKVAILEISDGNKVELLEYVSHRGCRREPVSSNDIGASHFAVTVDDIERMYRACDQYDVRFTTPPLLSPDGLVKVAYAVIMEEVIVELVQVLDD